GGALCRPPGGPDQKRVPDRGLDGPPARPSFHALAAAGRSARRGVRVVRARDRRAHQEHPQEGRPALHRDGVRRGLPIRRAGREMRAGGGRGRWRGWDSNAWPATMRRPSWWPEGEPFPPQRWGRRYGPPPFIRWIGCFVVTVLFVALLAGGFIGAMFSREGWQGYSHPSFPFFLVLVGLVVLCWTRSG